MLRLFIIIIIIMNMFVYFCSLSRYHHWMLEVYIWLLEYVNGTPYVHLSNAIRVPLLPPPLSVFRFSSDRLVLQLDGIGWSNAGEHKVRIFPHYNKHFGTLGTQQASQKNKGNPVMRTNIQNSKNSATYTFTFNC